MFKENLSHNQGELFNFLNMLSEQGRKKLLSSKYYAFYQLVFSRIKEEDFRVLYSDKASRPNVPINVLVGAIILKNMNNWTFEELFSDLAYDMKVRLALGCYNFEEDLFCEASMYNFLVKLNDYYIETGRDLIEQVFDNLTKKQLEKLRIKTDICRIDSTEVRSNIGDYSRLQILVEILRRLYRILSEDDKKVYEKVLEPYLKYNSSGQYIYHLNKGNIEEKYKELSKVYGLLHKELKASYGEEVIYSKFERVYTEHFIEIEDKIEVIPNKGLHSNILQSADDEDATYRKKRGEDYKGYVMNICESCNPENSLNLITDVVVKPNNVDDSVIMNERLDNIKEKMKDLKEAHTDGGYGSENNDKKMEELGITHIQTAIRGRNSNNVEIEIEQISENRYEVRCPNQTVLSRQDNKKHKVEFDIAICSNCIHKGMCITKQNKTKRIYRFTKEDYLMKKRHRNINNIPKGRRQLRNNVEASIREMKVGLNDSKLLVRGLFKTSIYAYTRAINVNFGRIFRYLRTKMNKMSSLISNVNAILIVLYDYFKIFMYYQNFCNLKLKNFSFNVKKV